MNNFVYNFYEKNIVILILTSFNKRIVEDRSHWQLRIIKEIEQVCVNAIKWRKEGVD